MKRALITGASGFLGHHVVRHLSALGHEVTCLVRPTSNVDSIQAFRPRFAYGDVTDPESVGRAVAGAEVVYHLAGLTKSLRRSEFQRVNVTGVRTVAAACAQQETPPVLVIASSLAAAGPAPKDRSLTESDPAAPVSYYGRSKRDGELAAAQFAAQVPTTIVRPPMVLGEWDRLGLPMYTTIARWGLHLMPADQNNRCSVVHADDLAAAMQLAALRGRRLAPHGNDGGGVYFVADDQSPTLAELGWMIANAIGRPKVRTFRIRKYSLWTIAAANEFASQFIRRKQHVINLDKVREATAGSWTCSPKSIQHDVGFSPAQTLQQRLCQTVAWYAQQGWLPLKELSLCDPEVRHQTCCHN